MACLASRSVGKVAFVSLCTTVPEQLFVFGIHHLGHFAGDQIEHGFAQPVFACNAKQRLECFVELLVASRFVFQVERSGQGLNQLFGKVQLRGNLLLHLFAFGDVGADRNVLCRQPVLVQQRNNGGTDPIKRTIFLAVFDLAIPDLARRHRCPEFIKQCRRAVGRANDAMVGTNEFFAGITTDVAKPVIGVGNVSLEIGDADDGVLIQRVFLVGQIAMQMLQLGLLCLLLVDQRGHLHHQPGQIVGGGIVVVDRLIMSQVADQCLEFGNRTFPRDQLLSQGVIDLDELFRGHLQAACSQIEVALKLRIGLVHTPQQVWQTIGYFLQGRRCTMGLQERP